mgnify:FL=1
MAAEQYDQHVEYRQNKFTQFNMDWYDSLRASKSNWTKVSEQRIHQNRGYPVHVKAGQVFKSILPEGSNIIDVWFFGEGIKNPAGEQYDPVLTAALEGFICRKNSRLWSNLPYFRPMATYINDNIDPAAMPDEHHWPVWHGGHCCPEAIEMGHDKLAHASCHTNCIEALVTDGYDFETADSLACTHNMCIFQPMAVTDQQMPGGHFSPTWHNSPSHLKPGTFVEYYAEIDLLLAIAHCPYGDQSKPPYEVDQYPVDVEVWETGIQPQERPEWTEWRPEFKARLERLKAKGHKGATGRYWHED